MSPLQGASGAGTCAREEQVDRQVAEQLRQRREFDHHVGIAAEGRSGQHAPGDRQSAGAQQQRARRGHA
jgi:hypothetical protein